MKGKKTKITFIVIIMLGVMVLSSCDIYSSGTPTPIVTQYVTPIATKTPSPYTPTPEVTSTPKPTAVPTPTPRSGPQVIGLYVSASGGRVLLTEYKHSWTRGEDIATFNAFASNEEVLNYAAYREMLVDCWFSFPDAANYKIGYQLSYTLNTGEKICVTIKKPSDIIHTEYLEVYLYDSVQQYGNGRWYTHLSDDDMDDETLLYSFKLTPGVSIKEVADIKLKTFVYKYQDDSDFDPATGEYIGTVSYEIDIIKN